MLHGSIIDAIACKLLVLAECYGAGLRVPINHLNSNYRVHSQLS